MATWVITGANRGIGKEFVERLLAAGHTVFAGMRDTSSFDIEHENLNVLTLDVSNTESAEKFGHMINSMTESVDVLVNNAGMMDGRWATFEEVDMEYSLDVLNVNTICLLYTSPSPRDATLSRMPSSA